MLSAWKGKKKTHLHPCGIRVVERRYDCGACSVSARGVPASKEGIGATLCIEPLAFGHVKHFAQNRQQYRLRLVTAVFAHVFNGTKKEEMLDISKGTV